MLALCGMLWSLPALAASEDMPMGHYVVPETGNIVGEVYRIKVAEGETLLDIAAEHGVGYEELRHANPDVSIWAPDAGAEVTIPARYVLPPERREGIVINMSELRLYYYPPTAKGETPTVETYPIGIGRDGYDTPLGVTKTTMKLKNPAWYPPDSIRQEAAKKGKALPSVVPAGPENPLGDRAILLDLPGYLIHGTNRPDGVGMRVSHGCIRMRPETIRSLFTRVGVGERVNIIDMPVKIGRDGNRLYLQSFPLDGQEIGMHDLLSALQNTPEAKGMPLDYTRLNETLKASGWQPIALAPLPEAVIEIKPEPIRWYDAFRNWQQSLETTRVTEERAGS
ncbi:MAG: L,D-transpeptidase family protein [Halomonas sp.]|nr:L,D-transpeptidase family protein [Halomonas sp.]MDN6298524.1 L,D-transpeptidase family protein [Halomonas sp.]